LVEQAYQTDKTRSEANKQRSWQGSSGRLWQAAFQHATQKCDYHYYEKSTPHPTRNFVFSWV